MLISIETHITCDFPGMGPEPPLDSTWVVQHKVHVDMCV